VTSEGKQAGLGWDGALVGKRVNGPRAAISSLTFAEKVLGFQQAC